MPIYEYHCRECDHTVPKLQKVSDLPLVQCPNCGQESLKKLVSSAGFRLSGQGWYETDFKKTAQAQTTDKPTKTADSKTADSLEKKTN